MQTTRIGHQGEQIAAEWLERHHFQVIDRNWKSRWCEIDLIAAKDDVIYFVEVKYRKNDLYGDGFAYITGKKLAQMQFAAEFWMQRNHYEGNCRLAAASVDGVTNDVEFIDDL